METDTIQLVDPLVLAIEAATAGGFFYTLKKILVGSLCLVLGLVMAAILWPAAVMAVNGAEESGRKAGPIGAVFNPFANHIAFFMLQIASMWAKRSDDSSVRSLGKLGEFIVWVRIIISLLLFALLFAVITSPIWLPMSIYNSAVYGGLDSETMDVVEDLQVIVDPSPLLDIEMISTVPNFEELEDERAADGTFMKVVNSYRYMISLKHKTTYLDGIIKYAEVSCMLDSPILIKSKIEYRTAFVMLGDDALVAMDTKGFNIEVPTDQRIAIANFDIPEQSLAGDCEVLKTSSEKSIFSGEPSIDVDEIGDSLVIKNIGSDIVTGMDLRCIKNLGNENELFELSLDSEISDQIALMPGASIEKSIDYIREPNDFLECVAIDIEN